MLTQRLFAHVSKKHHMTIPEYTEKFNINLFVYQNKGGDYKNGESPYMKNKYIHKHPFDQNEDIERIDKAIKIMQKEIDQLKKQI